MDEALYQASVTDYLQFATQNLQPGNITSVVAHLIRAERDPGFSWDPSPVDVNAFSALFTKFDNWKDTVDFDLMYLHWMRRL